MIKRHWNYNLLSQLVTEIDDLNRINITRIYKSNKNYNCGLWITGIDDAMLYRVFIKNSYDQED